MTKRILILLGATLLVSTAAASTYTLDDEALARMFISESSGIRHPDWRPIGYVIRQRAAARGITVAAYIGSRHHRHTRSASRPYIAFMNGTLEYPAGWPYDVTHWETVGRPAWERVLDAAHSVNTGEAGHGCTEPPLDWGGRLVDCENLQARLNGDWHEVDCGPTVNMMLTRGHREPVPDLRCAERRQEAQARRAARTSE